ncbi:MAG: hypothetical protein IT286_01250 [Proteobacteria bacterium]|jgi:hypothetical protein|nr:hypothetical protein [Pseudomonadota bacterium]
MNIRRIGFLALVVLTIIGCGKLGSGGGAGGPKPQVPGGQKSPLEGTWLSDCVNAGSGFINRLYYEIAADLKVSSAILVYANPNCTGSYVLNNPLGTPVTEPVYAQNFFHEQVSDIPENFHVIKSVSVGSSSTSYSVIFINDTEFYQLYGNFTSAPHATWNQWQGEADVSQFAANPVSYDPLVYDKLHFIRAELP